MIFLSDRWNVILSITPARRGFLFASRRTHAFRICRVMKFVITASFPDKMDKHFKLDNPAWYALEETHREFCVDYGNARFYLPDYCPFGGTNRDGNTAPALMRYAGKTGLFFVIGARPEIPPALYLRDELVCEQMIIGEKINLEPSGHIVHLTEKHSGDLFRLVNRVQPGYFREKTALMGNYYGIYKDDHLVAAAGERMKLNGYVEVSAVVTHPEHTGNGFASQLIAHTVNRILENNNIPFLHVAGRNTDAIRLYSRLNFKCRRKISFWNLAKTLSPE